MRKLSVKSKVIIGAVGAFVLGVGATVVYAAIPSTVSGNISACYRKSATLTQPKGAVRLINSDNGESCTSQETAVNWSGQTTGNLMVSKLQNAELDDIRWVYLNLKGLNFSGSSLGNSVFTGSDLSNANFSNVVNLDARMNKVKADGADFSNIPALTLFANDASFRGVNFSNSVFGNTDFTGSVLDNSNLRDAKLDGYINGGSYKNVDATGFTIDTEGQPQINNGDFSNADFSNSNISAFALSVFSSNFTNTNFTNSTFSVKQGGSTLSLRNNNLTGANFTNTTFNGVDFRDQDISQAILTGVTWENVLCPDYTNSNDNGNTCEGHLQP